jgi:hypothetical protein
MLLSFSANKNQTKHIHTDKDDSKSFSGFIYGLHNLTDNCGQRGLNSCTGLCSSIRNSKSGCRILISLRRVQIH